LVVIVIKLVNNCRPSSYLNFFVTSRFNNANLSVFLYDEEIPARRKAYSHC
jgi:hypothetical protein